ncbi:hypothetical protein [Actinomadura sp. 6N118]|uniref:hypothetical protein n=1 Tax=Actinomadura sp. 6N118 TaxID=3375151 RepID=UPI00378A554A
MLLHWDGTAWSPATVPTSGINELGEIGRDGTGALWVSGHATDTPNRPALLRYDGQRWERLQTPAVSGQSNVHMLQLAAVPTSDKVWLLGSGRPIVMTNS